MIDHPSHSTTHDHAGHDHGSHAGHSHGPRDFGRAFAIGTALNVGFVVAEVAFGVLANSTALLADAGHNLGDVAGLLLAWGALVLTRKPPTSRFTYGLRSSSILAALGNAIILLVAVGAILWEAVQRLFTPEPVASTLVILVAGIGIVINGATALLFLRGKDADVNIKGAYVHMLTDAGVSLSVVVAGVLIALTGAQWLDPLVGIVIAGAIVWGSWGLLRDSTNLALQAVPSHIDPAAVRRHLEALPSVASVHDLHIWPMSTTEVALTCHLIMPQGHPGDAALARIAQEMHAQFGIDHTTLQVELADGPDCKYEPGHVV